MNKFEKLRKLNSLFENKDCFSTIEILIKKIFLNKSAYVCSFGSESAVLLDMISKINNNFPIIFINTHKLFKETLDYKEILKRIFNITNIIEVFPSNLNIKNYDHNSDLWKKNPDLCCNIRKVLPLENALKNYEAWFSGRKGFHSESRKKKKIIELENNKYVVSPLLKWDQEKINEYFNDNKLVRHPLFNQGYLSIGCETCTSKSKSSDFRSGRWTGTSKTECGIHKN
tara:strand:- start:4701 stop:5384 length:684 start_codon:yes stop_codon:yes gene_type:complete